MDSLFTEQDPSEMYVFGYFVINIFTMLLAGFTLLIVAFAPGGASRVTDR
ncbi:hypothetical protein AERO9AM_30136 [Aeromicrobium sp. 9AM]|nr:hypothetical protein AERO9AM_30136 [Aeromicrobium sp. 9AM]